MSRRLADARIKNEAHIILGLPSFPSSYKKSKSAWSSSYQSFGAATPAPPATMKRWSLLVLHICK